LHSPVLKQVIAITSPDEYQAVLAFGKPNNIDNLIDWPLHDIDTMQVSEIWFLKKIDTLFENQFFLILITGMPGIEKNQ